MSIRLISLVLFLVGYGKLHSVNALSSYEWVPWEAASDFPENAFLLESTPVRYIGRTRHFDEILPAEIYANGSAFISSCGNIIPKETLEILTTSVKCEWKGYSYHELDNTAVRVGTAWNSEPVYLGTVTSSNYEVHVSSLYLSSGTTGMWFPNSNAYDPKYLSCKSGDRWIDTAVTHLPNNTVSGGKSDQDSDIFVARLKKDCTVVTGQAIPEESKAIAVLNDGSGIESVFCQVLVEGESKEYKWIPARNGEIPDYAIVSGKRGREQSYVARVNMTIGHLEFTEALNLTNYEILVNSKF